MDKSVRWPVRFSDCINYFASEAYVPEIHLIIHFDKKIEVPRLQKALRLLLYAEPVLGCRFVESWRKAFWVPLTEHELNHAEMLIIASRPPSEQEDTFQAFYAETIDSFTGPQLRALLFPRQDGDSLVLKINHVACDAGGFKEVLYRLSSIYNELDDDPDFRPDVRGGSRSLGQVYRHFNPLIRLMILWRGIKELFRAGIPPRSQQYPALKDKSSPLHFRCKHFSRERTMRILEYARNHEATLNDVFVTAVFRAIARQSNWDVNNKKAARITGTVDLRRYLPLGKADGLCMLSGVYSVILKDCVDDGFEETLFKIKAQIDEQKENYFGLGIMLVLYLMLSPYPFFLKKRLVKKQWHNNLEMEKVPPGLTNLGPIDNKKVDFGATIVKKMYMTAPACSPPWFCCGLSGFSDTLTLSSGFYPSSIPVEQIDDFFAIVDEELPCNAIETEKNASCGTFMVENRLN